jgi:hypothetical protein
MDFPIMQGKYRENSLFGPIVVLLGPVIMQKNSGLILKFPTWRSREFF